MGESGSDVLLFGGLLLAGLVTVWLALWLLWFAFAGAVVMLSFAAEQGFVGLAAFVAAWVFLFPVMLPIAIVLGFLFGRSGSTKDKRKRAAARWRPKQLGEPLPTRKPSTESPPDDPNERYKWANRLPPYDD